MDEQDLSGAVEATAWKSQQHGRGNSGIEVWKREKSKDQFRDWEEINP